MKTSSLLIIFVTVFVYLVGFGMIIPVLPALSLLYDASAFEVGLVMSTYSLHQFLFAPIWGKLSDRFGRRPILLLCLACEALTYIGLAFADSYWSLVVFRSLAGVFGGSISTASAYVADVTDRENRSKGMGMIGAAFGLGFVLGPVIGGVLISVGHSISSEPPFGLNFPALAVAAFCAATFVFAFFKLPEPERRKSRNSRAKLFKEVAKNPLSLVMLFSFFMSSFAMANIEPTLFLLVFDRFEWSGETASYAFAYVGVMMAFTQGYLIRVLLPRWGEPALLLLGLGVLTAGFVLIAVSYHLAPLTLAVTFVALGTGLFNPSLLGSLSGTVPDEIQGEIFGVTQSLSALGRILGPITGGWFYGSFGTMSPFLLAGALSGMALLLMGFYYRQLPRLARAA